jgi:hypothetical protein
MEIWDEDFDGSFSGVTPRKGGAPSSGVHVGAGGGHDTCRTALPWVCGRVRRLVLGREGDAL